MILIWNTILVRIGSVYYYYVNDLLNVNCEIMSNAGNELNDDFYVEETDIMVTPSPKPKKRKTSEYMCILYFCNTVQTDALTIIVFKKIQFKTI